MWKCKTLPGSDTVCDFVLEKTKSLLSVSCTLKKETFAGRKFRGFAVLAKSAKVYSREIFQKTSSAKVSSREIFQKS